MDSTLTNLLAIADNILVDGLVKISSCKTIAALQDIKVSVLGKNGSLTEMLRNISKVSAADRGSYGKHINVVKKNFNQSYAARLLVLEEQQQAQLLASQNIDISLPGRDHSTGRSHPISIVSTELTNMFANYGFAAVYGSEIEDDFHNFTALNIPEHHPARAMHDTFYLPGGLLLRTHTSPAQIHTMVKSKPPLRIISTGKVYRCDSDPTHSPMFHQLEGLVVNKSCSFVEMKSLIFKFLKDFFARDVEIRFRPSYFPFTEPSAEVDIRLSPESKWLEVMGCGMVHPNVFKQVGLDSNIYSGYAFGLGIDRLAMLKYGVNDLRLFFENDIDFLQQF